MQDEYRAKLLPVECSRDQFVERLYLDGCNEFTAIECWEMLQSGEYSLEEIAYHAHMGGWL